MSVLYVVVDPRTGEPAESRGWGKRGPYAYRRLGSARAVATRMGLSHADVVRFVPEESK
ncbi:hypothetical protein [Micromonospora sp. NBC_01813]|uniref:hypothetical protein n=1 Tax=Micromonospora sp. NBC_01813 TaxID=2975988 RepID=UPI002DD8A3FC|nr:hypothetical protein [Micromonospora sp. NBC_01813]WSA11579.1 hypothetical protein OG958_12790 [Micromonospora sp. NBC_01813]